MKDVRKEVALPAVLLIAAVLSLTFLVDWSAPEDQMTEEDRLRFRCEEELSDSLVAPISDECERWSFDRMNPWVTAEQCAKEGGTVWNRDLCSRTVDGVREYLDPDSGYWYDCLVHFSDDATEIGDGLDTHCGWPGMPDCLVEPPHWCPENLPGFRDALGKLHLE